MDFQGRFEQACSSVLTLQVEAHAAAQTEKLAEICPELESILVSTGMERYLDTFIDEGFDTRAALDTVTDEDLKALGVKAGHRRVLLAALDEMKTSPTSATDEEDDQSRAAGASEAPRTNSKKSKKSRKSKKSKKNK